MYFADHVRTLAHLRAQIAIIKDRRSEVYAVLTARYLAGDLIVGGGKMLRTTATKPGQSYRTVPADVVKRAYPQLWAASRVVKPHVSVTVPPRQKTAVVAAAAQAVGTLPPVPDINRPASYVARVYEGMPAVAPLDDAVAASITALREIAAVCDWDGLPIKFADGWKVGLDHLVYDPAMLEQLDPKVYDELAVDKVRETAPRVFIASVSAHADGEALASE